MMTHFRKIFVFALVLCALPFVGKAQSSPSNPYEGAVHTYVVGGLTPGVEYQFYVSANEDGSGVLDDGSTFEFDFLDTPYGTLAPNESTASLPLVWNNGSAQHIYYLWIALTNSEGCSTSRGLKVVPQTNMFDLLSENIPVGHTVSCPVIDEASGFNPLATEYNLGTTTLQFKVRREGGNRGWSFEPLVTVDPSWNLDVAIVSVIDGNAGELFADATNSYFVPAAHSEVIVTVVVNNLEGVEQIVKLEVINQIEEKTRLRDSNPSNDYVQHRITVMPIISDLEGI